MKLFLILTMTATMLASPAEAKRPSRDAPPDCALEAQHSVARRHGLRETAHNTLPSKIYADPRLAQEADDAFDACVRRQLSGQ